MKRPGDTTPEPPGGRVLERLKMFEVSRGSLPNVDTDEPLPTRPKTSRRRKKNRRRATRKAP